MRLPLIRSLRYAWYVVAALLVFAAGASVALRIALPRLDAQRPAVERWASRLTGQPVHVERLRASWQGVVPTLRAEGLRIGAPDSGLRFDRAEVDVALLASVRQRDLVLERVVLSGIALGLRRKADGAFEIIGIEHRRSAFIDWLLRQRDVRVERAELVFTDALRGSAPRRFSDITVQLAGGRVAVLRGHIGSASLFGREPEFELHLPRDPAAARELRLQVAGLAPGPLLEFAGRSADEAAPLGALDGRLWLRWQEDGLTRVALDGTGHLDGRGATGPDTLRVAGVASRHDAAWHLRVDALRAGPSAGSAAPMRGAAEIRPHPGGVDVDASAELLTLDVVTALAQRLPAALTASRGELQGLRLALRQSTADAPRWFIVAGLAHGSLGAYGQWPAVDGIDAGVAVNPAGGALAFDNGGLRLAAGERLVEPLAFGGATGSLSWRRLGEGWRVASPLLRGAAAEIPFELNGYVDLHPRRRPRVEAELELGAADLTRLPRLLPKGVLKERAERWFRQAFKAGALTHASAELRGDLAQFPFDAGEGLFLLDFDVTDVTLQYSDKWPIVEDVAAHGAVAGRQFRVTSDAARFFDSPGRDIDLSIADLFNPKPVLVGVANVRATLADTLRTIAQSPLRDGPARRLSTIGLDGAFDLTLDLNIGLKRGEERTVLGVVDFDGNRLRTQDGKLTLDDLRGRVSFTREDFYGEALTATYDGQPVGLVVNGGIGDPNYETEFRMTGTSDAARILGYVQQYAPYLHDWLARTDKLGAVSGEAPWKAVLSLPHTASGAAPAAKKLRIESSLNGLGIDLPWPFGKVAAEQKALTIETAIGSDAARTTRLAFGSALRFELDQAKRDDTPGSGRITRADIAFGASEAAATQPGIYLHGELSTLPLAEWALLLRDAATPQSPMAGLPIAFDVRVKELATLGQRFADVGFRGEKDSNAWRIDMTGARAAGTITVPLDLQSAPLTLNLERLWLEKRQPGGARTELDPRRIPAVALACGSFKYGTVDFGSASMSTARTSDGQRLEKLVFNNDALQVAASGAWELRDGLHRSRFSIDVKGKALGDLLATFGYDAANIEGGRTSLALEADWLGTPSEFTLDRLDGSLGLKVGKGRFLDIDPGGGRLFGLLSLQTLPRRLSLDFSDLFEKGFAFDRIEGWFELEKGNAYTNSLLMEGPSAKVEISGRTGLAAKDYDQLAVVTPALSDSIPIASALFGPAGIGVGAAIYLGQKMFKEVPAQVDRFLRRQYAVTGPWSDPKVEKR